MMRESARKGQGIRRRAQAARVDRARLALLTGVWPNWPAHHKTLTYLFPEGRFPKGALVCNDMGMVIGSAGGAGVMPA